MSRKQKIAKWYIDSYESKIFKYVIVPALFVLPVFLLGVYANSKFQESIKLLLEVDPKLQPAAVSFIDRYLVVFFFVAVGFSYTVSRLYDISKYIINNRTFKFEHINLMNFIFESLVKNKTKRFIGVASSGSLSDKALVFSQITRPEQQIMVLCEYLHKYFTELYKKKFKVRVLKIEGGAPDTWIGYAPSLPETHPSALNCKESSVSKCIRKRDIIVISDVMAASKLHKPIYKNTHEDEKDDDGSLVCYPCTCEVRGGVSFVIIVSCIEKGFFNEMEKDVIEMMLEKAKIRVSLESTLLMLKG